MRWLNLFKPKKTPKSFQNNQNTDDDKKTSYTSLNQGLSFIQNSLFNTDDLIIKKMIHNEKQIIIMYLDTFLDKKLYQKAISLFSQEKELLTNGQPTENFDTIAYLETALQEILAGKCIILFEEVDQIFVIDIHTAYNRSVEEPANERIIIGQHEGFVESLKININLIRKRITNPSLVIRNSIIGDKSNTNVSIVYMKNIASEQLVSKIQKQLDSLTVSHIESSGAVMQLLEPQSFSPFPQMLSTERPDRVTSNLLEGKVVLLVDGSPSVLILPVSLFTFFQSPDDYNTRWMMGTFYRMIRIASFFVAITFPAFYIATVSFHPEVIPTGLIIIVKQAVDDIPYPHIVEAFIMEITLELLREASVRLPNPIGQTIGIVGGLVIGDAIVNAGLVSNIMIIIVAITAISSFVVPSHEMSASIRLIRFPMMFSAAIFGYVGIVFFYMLLLIHLCRLTSFNEPYLSPLVPFKIKELKDSMVRFPTRMLKNLQPKPKTQSSFKEWDDHA